MPTIQARFASMFAACAIFAMIAMPTLHQAAQIVA